MVGEFHVTMGPAHGIDPNAVRTIFVGPGLGERIVSANPPIPPKRPCCSECSYPVELDNVDCEVFTGKSNRPPTHSRGVGLSPMGVSSTGWGLLPHVKMRAWG